MFIYSKKAFTFVELIISATISAIVLVFLLVFLWDVFNEMNVSQAETKNIIIFKDFSSQLNIYRNLYKSWSILVDNTSTWSDIIIMKSVDWKDAILLWVVNPNTLKIDTIPATYYKESVLWFRSLSNQELLDLQWNPNLAYNYIFQKDKLYYWLMIKDFQANIYSNLIDLDLSINLYFNKELVWELWVNLPKIDLKKFNLDF